MSSFSCAGRRHGWREKSARSGPSSTRYNISVGMVTISDTVTGGILKINCVAVACLLLCATSRALCRQIGRVSFVCSPGIDLLNSSTIGHFWARTIARRHGELANVANGQRTNTLPDAWALVPLKPKLWLQSVSP